MKKFLICLLSMFMLASFTACGNNGEAENVSSAKALTRKLTSESDKKIAISEDIVLTEAIEIVGNKEIVGTGTIKVSVEGMKESYMIQVSDGAQLTVGGNITLDLAGLAGGIYVKEGAVFNLQDEATLKGASSKTANARIEGTFNMNGGTISEAYHNVVCDGKSAFVWNAGTISSSDDDAIIVGKDAKITITSADATLTGVAARGLYLYGEGVIENTTMTDSMDSMIKIAASGKLTFKNGKVSDAGLHGIDNAGELLVAGGTIFENYDSGICNTGSFEMTGGTLMNNKNKGVLNKSGTAKIVSASVTLTGNKFAVGNEEGAYFELANAKILQSTTTNVYAYGGEMYIHDIVLATSGSNNMRVVAADVTMEDMEIKGINATGSRTMHGLLLEGGNVTAKNVIIGNTTGNAIRNKGGHIKGENITIKDVKNIGIDNRNQDVTDREGTIELTNVTVENVKNNNVLVEGGKVTLINATLERCATNNIKTTDGKLIIKNSVVNGNVADAKDNNHAIYMTGGTIEANDVKIQNAAGASLRINGEEALFNGKKIVWKNAGVTGINMSLGTVKIDGLTTSGMKDHNIKMAKGTVDIKNATLCKTRNNNVRMTNDGNLVLTNVEIQGTVAGVEEVVHGLFVSKGTTTAKNIKIIDAKVAALRVNSDAKVNLDGVEIVNPGQLGMQINAGTTVISGLTTSGVPSNNIQLYGDAVVTVKDSTLGKNKDNSIRMTDNSKLELEDVLIEGHAEGTASNAHGIYALGESTLTTKKLTVQNVNGAAVRTLDTPKVTLDDMKIKDAGTYGFRLGGGTVTVTNLKTENVGAHNFAVETATCNLTVKDAVLCPTENNNVRVNKGTTHFENVEILGQVEGVKEVVHGFFVTEGTTTAKNLTIKDADTAAIRVNGNAKVKLDGVDIKDPGQLGIQVNAGTTVITDLTTSGVPSNNIQMYGNADLTVKKSTLGKNADNSIRVDEDAKLTLEEVVVKGHVENAKGTNHGIFLKKGTVTAKDLTVNSAQFSAIRVSGGKLEAEQVTISGAGDCGINASAGTTKITGLTTEDVTANNVYMSGTGVVTLNQATLGATDKENVKFIENSELTLNRVSVNGKTGKSGYMFCAEGKRAELNDVIISDDDKNDYVGIWLNSDNCELLGNNVTLRDMQYGIISNKGSAEIDGLTSGATTQNILSNGGTVTVNGYDETNSILEKTSNNNVKVEKGKLYLNDVTIQGSTDNNTNGIYATGTGEVEANRIMVQDTNASVFRISGTSNVVANTVATQNIGGHGINMDGGIATFTGFNTSGVAKNNIYMAGTCKATVNNSVFCATTAENVKITGNSELILNNVSVNGKTGKNGYMFCAEGKKAELNNVTIVDADKNDYVGIWLNADNCELTGNNVTLKDMQYGFISNKGKATITGLTSYATAQDIWSKAGTVNVENLNNTVTEKAIIYNTISNLNLAGVINATVTNDAKVAVNATKSLAGSTMVIDWTEGNIPEDLVGIKFVNEADAQASKQAVSLGANSGAKYDTYFFGNQMLLNEKNNKKYTVENYQELASALADVEDKNATSATITVAGNIEATAEITIKENRSIRIQDDGTARTISSSADGVFNVESGATLTLASTGNNTSPKLTVTGANMNCSTTDRCSLITNSGTLTIEAGVKVADHACDKEGHNGLGIYAASGSATTFKGVLNNIKGTHNKTDGSAILVEGGAISFENAVVSNNATGSSGSIWITAGGSISATNTTFTGNTAGGYCGGVWVDDKAVSASFTGCEFTSNTSVSGGSALIAGIATTVTDCDFKSNIASGSGSQGGAICIWNKGCVIAGSTFDGNNAGEGGAITISGSNELTLSDSTFANNVATKSGTSNLATWGKDIRLGAAGTKLNIYGKVVAEIFHRNTSCVNVVDSLTEGSKVVIDWSSNEAKRIPTGEAIVFTSNGTASADVMNVSREYISLGANMTNTDYRLSYNQSEAKAYLVTVTKVSEFSGDNGLQKAITSATPGVTKNIRITGDITVTSTTALPDNSDIVIEDDGTAHTIQRGAGFASSARGVLFDVNSGATLTLTSTGTVEAPKLTFDGNRANYSPTNGNWAIIVAKSGSKAVNIYEGVQFINNSSTGAGAVLRMEQNSGSLYIDGARFQNNIANNNNGGVIYLKNTTATNEIQNASFIGNEANAGGVIMADSSANVTISSSTFTKNKATKATDGYGGGAIYAYWGTIALTDCTFTENSSAHSGGAVYSQQVTKIENCYFNKNVAAENGGAIYHRNENGVATLNGTDSTKAVFYQNSAKNGGAIYTHGKSMSITDYKFDSNTASVYGGAIFSGTHKYSKNTKDTEGKLQLVGTSEGAVFVSNSADKYGGAIYYYTGTLTLTNYKFESNSPQDIWNNTSNTISNTGSSYTDQNSQN